MALIFNHNAGNSWRRSAYASVPALVSKVNANPGPVGSFNSNLVSSLNKITEPALSTSSSASPAVRTTTELPTGFNLKPPGRGLSPGAWTTGQNNNVNFKPPNSLAYTGLTANQGQALSGQRDGLAQINRSINRAAARGQFTGINNKIYSEEKFDLSAQPAMSCGSQSRRYYEKLAEQSAARHGVDPNLVKAVITAESGYNPNVVSKAGAMGLMQLMPATASDMQVKNPFDPKQNIEGGTKYLAWLSQQFEGDERSILAAYNWGPGNMRRGGNMPSETLNYLVKVSQFKRQYQQLAKQESNEAGRLAQAAGNSPAGLIARADKPPVTGDKAALKIEDGRKAGKGEAALSRAVDEQPAQLG